MNSILKTNVFVLMFLEFLIVTYVSSIPSGPGGNTPPESTVNIVPYKKCVPQSYGSFYDFVAMDIDDSMLIPMSRYRGKQEPGANGTEILNSVRWVRPGGNFIPGFQFFRKIQVNGNNEHPIYTFLKSSCPPTRDGYRSPVTDLYYSPITTLDVRWNFEKFLIDHLGNPIYRFDATTEPLDIEHIIVEAIGNIGTEQGFVNLRDGGGVR